MNELLRVEELKKWFPVRLGFLGTLTSRKSLFVRAVDGVSFDVKEQEIFGLVGESGSGKTTTGRAILRLTEPTGGKVFFKDKEVTHLSTRQFKPLRREMQVIFQDPYESLNPKMTVQDIISEPLTVQGVVSSEQDLNERVHQALEDVRLVPPDEFLHRYPHELSGGQRQRVATGRALVLHPSFLVADEPVSMLDASIRAEVLNLMFDLMKKYDVSFLYITHDIALSRHICSRIAVMYLGKIVELGTAEEIVYEPLHPYTNALITAVPRSDPKAKRSEAVLKGEIPSPVNPPSGCRFHTRCPEYLGEICKKREPPIIDAGGGHLVACHKHS